MKTFLLISISIISLFCFAADPSIKGNTFENLQKIADKKLDAKKDLELVKRTLKVLLELDNTDPSRTGPAILATSYGNNEDLYKKAAKQIETKKNRKALKEILEVMKSLSETGNG